MKPLKFTTEHTVKKNFIFFDTRVFDKIILLGHREIDRSDFYS